MKDDGNGNRNINGAGGGVNNSMIQRNVHSPQKMSFHQHNSQTGI